MVINSPNVLMPPCTNVHPLLASGVTAGDKALGRRLSVDGGGGHRRGWQGHTDTLSTQSSSPSRTPGSARGLPLPSPCLHSHLPVREPRPPHSSHSGRLLLTAQDRGQPGSSATSGGGRKQVTGGQPGPCVQPPAPTGEGSSGSAVPTG